MSKIASIKPWLRAAKYHWLRSLAEYEANRSSSGSSASASIQPVFLVGCGRSGTTILGEILSLNSEILYFFEPYHLWAAINPITDVLNLYHQVQARFCLDEIHKTEQCQARFNRLFVEASANKKSAIFIEKTPLNCVRIGYLNALAPQAKFIHIVRDGVDVARSIERLASTNRYQIAGKPRLNQWWGVDHAKAKALVRDGIACGYYPEEANHLQDDCSLGAYEWLVSLGEVDRWRDALCDRLHELTYDDLTANPEATLRHLCQFLELDCSSQWLQTAVGMIGPASRSSQKSLHLPPTMCEAFNHHQAHFGFSNRAISSPLSHALQQTSLNCTD